MFTLLLQPVVWVALGIVALIKFNFDYLLVVGVAIILNAANIVGFTKCRKGIIPYLLGFLNFSWSQLQSLFYSVSKPT